MIVMPTPAERLQDHVNEIRQLGQRAIADVIEIGRRLSECKDLVGHGNWLSWLDREFGWSERTAQNFIAVFHLSRQSKSANFSDFQRLNLPISALYLLARPSTPEAARDEILQRAQAGETMSLAKIEDTVRLVVASTPVRTAHHPPTTVRIGILRNPPTSDVIKLQTEQKNDNTFFVQLIEQFAFHLLERHPDAAAIVAAVGDDPCARFAEDLQRVSSFIALVERAFRARAGIPLSCAPGANRVRRQPDWATSEGSGGLWNVLSGRRARHDAAEESRARLRRG
jgi:hypothetical protein